MNPLTPLAYCIAAWFVAKTFEVLRHDIVRLCKLAFSGVLWLCRLRIKKRSDILPIQKLSR